MVSQPRSVQSSRWDGAIFLVIPGTSCLATIVLSLRDKRQKNACWSFDSASHPSKGENFFDIGKLFLEPRNSSR